MRETHHGRILQVVEYDVDVGGGKKKTFEKARRAPGVRIIIEKENKILLNKEYRYELDAYDRRLPGGKVFDTLDEYLAFLKSGEDIDSFVLESATRESKEEVGIDIVEQEILTKKICGATIERDLWYIYVRDFSYNTNGVACEEGEVIAGYKWFSYKEIKQMIVDSEIQEGRTAAVLAQVIFSEDRI